MPDVNEACEPRTADEPEAIAQYVYGAREVQQALDVLEDFVKVHVLNEPHAVDLMLELRRVVTAAGASAPFVGRIGLDNLGLDAGRDAGREAGAGPGIVAP